MELGPEFVRRFEDAVTHLEDARVSLAKLEERSCATIKRLDRLERKISNGIEDRMRAVEETAALSKTKLAVLGAGMALSASLVTAIIFATVNAA